VREKSRQALQRNSRLLEGAARHASCEPEDAGVYRKDIPIHRTYFHEIAQPAKIHVALLKVLEYMKARQDKDMHVIELAANVHHRFMRVFPFSDYSGIIGRLMANFLMNAGRLLAGNHSRL